MSKNTRECPFCAEDIDANATTCPQCNEAVPPVEPSTMACPFCAEEIDADARTCPECGERLRGGDAVVSLTSGLRSKPGIVAIAAIVTVAIVAAVAVGGGGDKDADGSRASTRGSSPKTTTTTLPTFTNSEAAALLALVPSEIAGTCDDEADEQGQGYLICNYDPAVVSYERYPNTFEMIDFYNFLAEEHGARAAGAPATAGGTCPYETTFEFGKVICYIDNDSINIQWTQDALLILASVTIFKDNITQRDIEAIHAAWDAAVIQ